MVFVQRSVVFLHGNGLLRGISFREEGLEVFRAWDLISLLVCEIDEYLHIIFNIFQWCSTSYANNTKDYYIS